MTTVPQRSLSSRTARASLWTVGGKLSSKALDFISLLILARFLDPGDFGVVAMAMTSVQIVEALSELPLSSVLLNYQKPTDDMFNTAFTLAVMRCIGIWVLLSALSWPMSILYHEPRLIGLQCALAFAPAMRVLGNQRLVEYARVFDFRRDVAIDGVAKMVSLIIATTLAITTHSYWAIAVSTISTATVSTIISHILAPHRVRFTMSQWRIFADMIGWNAAGQVLSAINWQTDKLVLPRFVDTVTFGRFTSADSLISIPVQAIVLPITRPLFSAFVAVRDNGGIGRVYLKASVGIFSIVGPVLLMIAMLSEPVVQLILGPKWTATAPILTWLAFAALALLPSVVLPALAMALNRTHISFIRLVAEFCVKVPIIVILATTLHLQGVLIGHAISSVVVFWTCMVLVKSLTGLSVKEQLKGLSRPMISMIPTALFLYAASRLFGGDDTILFTLLNLIWVCAGAILLFAATDLLLWKLARCPDGCERFGLKAVKSALRLN